MAGRSGPIPNRSEDLARPRERKGGDAKPTTRGVARDVKIPNADRKNWHPIAVRIWDAAKESGQADFYQASDWAILFSICEDLTVYKRSTKRSGQMLQTIYSALNSLLLTEGERRRAGIELDLPDEGEEDVALAAVHDMKAHLRAVPEAS